MNFDINVQFIAVRALTSVVDRVKCSAPPWDPRERVGETRSPVEQIEFPWSVVSGAGIQS